MNVDNQSQSVTNQAINEEEIMFFGRKVDSIADSSSPINCRQNQRTSNLTVVPRTQVSKLSSGVTKEPSFNVKISKGVEEDDRI